MNFHAIAQAIAFEAAFQTVNSWGGAPVTRQEIVCHARTFRHLR